MATSAAAAAATLVINNTTPVAALTLTAKYKGTYGHNLTATVQTDARDGTQKDLVLSINGNVVETYSYAPTDITSLGAEVNAQSKWVTAVVNQSGVGLTTTTNAAFSAGADGGTLIAQDWTDMMKVAETSRFSLFAPFEMIDAGIQASIRTWMVNLNLNGKRFMWILGGALSESVSTAVTRSMSATLASNENIINLGVGGIIDSELGTLSMSQLAPRVAGIMAARGETMSLTYARLVDTLPFQFPTESEILQAFNGGVVVLSQDSHPDTPVRIEKGLTTYTDTTHPTKPYLIYRNPKFLRTMHGIETRLTEWAAFNAIGQLQVNNQTRAYVVGYAHDVIKQRADRGIVQQGYTVVIDPTPPPSDFDEFIALLYGIAFGRSVEQIFNTVYVS